jgi:hypothetical protein
MPELRRRINAASTQLEALEAQLIDREAYLRLSENLETFLSTLHERSQTLSVEERQKILRLVVKEVQVDHDKVVIKHSIRPSDGDSGLSYQLRWGSHSFSLSHSKRHRCLLARDHPAPVDNPDLPGYFE